MSSKSYHILLMNNMGHWWYLNGLTHRIVLRIKWDGTCESEKFIIILIFQRKLKTNGWKQTVQGHIMRRSPIRKQTFSSWTQDLVPFIAQLLLIKLRNFFARPGLGPEPGIALSPKKKCKHLSCQGERAREWRVRTVNMPTILFLIMILPVDWVQCSETNLWLFLHFTYNNAINSLSVSELQHKETDPNADRGVWILARSTAEVCGPGHVSQPLHA